MVDEQKIKNKSWKYLLISVLCFLLAILMLVSTCAGCNIVFGKRDYYRPRTQDVPVEAELSFESKEALASGATLNNSIANKIYYEGTEAKSYEAGILLDMSLRFLGFLGVNTSVDPKDPESVKQLFAKADKALKEKDRIIHDLKKDVKEYRNELNKKQTYIKEKEKENLTLRGKIKKFIYGIIGTICTIGLILLVLQIFTGIPFFTASIGAVRTLFGVAKQTVEGLQDIRNKLKEKIAKEKDEEKRKMHEKMLAEIDATLDKHQDGHVKKHIKKMKSKLKEN